MGYRDIDQQMFRTLKKTKPQNCPDNRLVRLKRTLMKHIDDVPSSGIITKKNLCVGIYSHGGLPAKGKEVFVYTSGLEIE